MACEWDREVEIAVVGSGAAGFTAALTAHGQGLRVEMFEKADVFGGTTALSGGVAWVPGNHLMQPAAAADAVLRYLRHHVGNRSSGAKLEAFVAYAPEMLRYLTGSRAVRFARVAGFPDYHAETPGGDSAVDGGGRSVEPLVFPTTRLGDWRPAMLHRPRNLPVVGTMTELRRLAAYRTDLKESFKAWRAIPRTLWGRLTGAGYASGGAALIGWMAYAAKRAGIALHLSCRLESLVVENGSVKGAVFASNGRTVRMAVRRGLILATGGFDHNIALREQYLPAEGVTDFSSGAPSNTGDGQLAAGEAGAALAQMDDAWWAPSCLVPGVGPLIVIFERGKPGHIIVDARGQRFANEAQPYGAFVRAMFEAQRSTGTAIPAYMVFDQTFRHRYPVGHLLPGVTPESAIESGFLSRASNIASLCDQIGVDADGLKQTLGRFNGFAVRGVDEDFHRGEAAFDRYAGDPTHRPNPCLAPVTRPPFYALRIYPGDLGAHGGIVTDEHARALDEAGEPIRGLYAAGNCAASALGGFYPGAGGTIGPAMTFGYIAARHLAGVSAGRGRCPGAAVP